MKFLLVGALLAAAPCLMADEQDDLRKLLEMSAPKEEAPKAPMAPTSEPSSAEEEPSQAEATVEEAPAEEAPAAEAPAAEAAAADVASEPPVAEEAPATPPPAVSKYKVWIWQETGDTLWRIAQKVYGDKDKWRLIYSANQDVIKDPNKIYPKQKLKIPPPDWQP